MLDLGFWGLGGLLVLSAFFSASETAVTAIDRYRLSHRAQGGHRASQLLMGLLQRQDRLLGTILIGNNVVNLTAASLTTLIALQLGGQEIVATATGLLTLIVLIFAEIVPKTIAARYPENFTSVVIYPLLALVWVFIPVLMVISVISNLLLRPFRIDVSGKRNLALSPAQLATVVRESGSQIDADHRRILLSVLNLSDLRVVDSMVPRNQIVGIDLQDDMDTIGRIVRNTTFNRVPVYHRTVNDVIGTLNLKRLIDYVSIHGRQTPQLTKNAIELMLAAPHFVPEDTPLYNQLESFQNDNYDMALVVNEYGEVSGLITLRNALQGIVGKMSKEIGSAELGNLSKKSPENRDSLVVEGQALVRDINLDMHWRLPADGPRTISGLIIQHIETLPHGNICTEIGDYRIETLQLDESSISSLRISRIAKEQD